MTTVGEEPDWTQDGWTLGPLHRRADPAPVARALARLAVHPPRGFVAFHERYTGQMGSDNTGFELLDMCVDEPDYRFEPSSDSSIVTCTELVRGYQIPHQHLCISTYLGNAVLMYDTITDVVYNMDFEGSDEQLRRGVLEPQFPSFRAFLAWFFNPGENA